MAGVRTRFAPSPTGDLHIGSARTALFAWLFARQQQGTFILRIEDTDRERSTQAATDGILEAMRWLGLDYDEGPYYQTQRFDRYQQILEQLLQSGHAYRCYCSKERLDSLREQQMSAKQKPRYDGHCRELTTSLDQPFVIRFRNPTTGSVTFKDLVRGSISVQNEELDDLILARSDGTPTYNFVVVVDDWDMEITHVIRGDDHINNTPRQINIFKALSADIPEYGHMPMILGSDGKRLSKRHGASGVLEYREAGFLPQALINYLVRLGWSHQDQEIFSYEDMLRYFNIHDLQRAPAALNPEKLLWLNQHYLKTLDPAITAQALADQLEKKNISVTEGPALTDIITLFAERTKTLQDMADSCQYFFQPIEQYDAKAVKKHLTTDAVPALTTVRDRLNALDSWESDTIHQIIKDVAAEQSLSLGKVAQPIRVSITGNTMSPSIDATLFTLGKATVLERLQNAIDMAKGTIVE